MRPGGAHFSGCPKRAKPFWDKRLAACRAHNLFAESEQIPHLQTEKYFRPGTRPGRKWIAFHLPPAGGKLCEAILTEQRVPPGRIFCESVAYDTEFLLERGYNRTDKIGKEGFSDVLHKKGQ
jgi:hypothetical protein